MWRPGGALTTADGQLVVGPCWAPRLDASTPAELRWGIDANLIGLRVDRVDAINLRLFDTDDPHFDEKLGVMADAKQEGKIGAIGLSNIKTDASVASLVAEPPRRARRRCLRMSLRDVLVMELMRSARLVSRRSFIAIPL